MVGCYTFSMLWQGHSNRSIGNQWHSTVVCASTAENSSPEYVAIAMHTGTECTVSIIRSSTATAIHRNMSCPVSARSRPLSHRTNNCFGTHRRPPTTASMAGRHRGGNNNDGRLVEPFSVASMQKNTRVQAPQQLAKREHRPTNMRDCVECV